MIVVPISGKAGHGKDTLAGFMKTELERRGKRVLITHYGDLVKYVCRMFFGWDGQKDEAGRTLLQRVGTDVVRKQRPDYWVDFVRDMLMFFDGQWDYVLVPDTRFPNEVDGLDPLRVIHVRIIRPGYSTLTPEQQAHPSETALDRYQNVQIVIRNDKGLEELESKASVVCDELIQPTF